ncbi:proteasome regulatory subunit [Cryptosporidium ubiquitum]|uniref:Proteasome regulatory subunit n=1 Tax=Cryptosporidium ubiquitum TaxID=857276 RepID=A0A1J4MER2_9CRYT|nr:proteasome regulatory subunit [Cryptosporidium ubiquitum]OII72487.1 proteasome regulatory subunit [Cryptosporidium ubiquitum]
MESKTPMEQLELELNKRAEYSKQIEQLKTYLKEKLYFQYLESSLEYISIEGLRIQENDLCEFLINAIEPLKNNFDPLRYAVFVGEVLSRSPTDIQSKVQLLKKLMGEEDLYQVKDNYKNASLTQEQNIAPKQEIKGDLYFRCLLALEYSKSKDLSIDCEETLEFLTQKLDSYRGLEAEILALYHRSYASYEKTMGRVSRFYKQAIHYLSYTPINKIPYKEKPSLVYDLIMAAVISEDIYNMGELVLHPVVQEFSSIVKGSNSEQIDELTKKKFLENAWILEVLVSLHEGDIDSFMNTISKHQDKVNKTPLSIPEIQVCVTKKTTTLALMDLAFRKNKNERILTFEEIAKHCRIGINEIELLVMKAINMNLIRGIIDQVSQTVEISWVHSRVLDKARMKLLMEKMDNWINSTMNVVSQLENIAPELVNC